MAYTVLARRYRSANFDEVVGQEHIAQTLKKAIDSGRIAHAYLFCGTRGTGKTSTARILAKALNCEKSDKPTSDPCGKCNSCVAIARGDDMDVIEIDAASNTGVDNVRQLIENAQFRPARSRFKVYIIDEVHMLSKAAFNALLKTMEEPPEHVKFILATTEPEKVLATILSRCQRYDFRSIPTAEIAKHLKSVTQQEKIKADDDALLMVAKAGAGSMRDSLSLLDRLLSIGETELTLEMIEQLLGLPKSQMILELVEAVGSGDVKSVLERADKMLASGLSTDSLLSTLVEHLRNLLVLRTCGEGSGLVEVPGVSIKELAVQAGKFEVTTLTQDVTILEELRRLMRQGMASRSLLDATLVRLALAEQFTSIAELLSGEGGSQKKKFEGGDNTQHSTLNAQHSRGNVERPTLNVQLPTEGGSGVGVVNVELDLEDDLPRPGKVWDNSGPSLSEMLKQKQGSEPPAQVVSAAAHPASDVAPVSADDLQGIWSNLLAAVGDGSMGLVAMLRQGRLVGVEDGVVVIAASNAFAKDNLDRNNKKDVIRDTLCKILNRQVGLKIVVDEAAPVPVAKKLEVVATPANPAHRVVATPEPVAAAVETGVRMTPELREQLRQDPLVKSVLEILGGDIVKVDQ